MQTLWSRAARSNCTCRCLLCLNTARIGLAGRAPTAAGIRQIKLKDTIIAAYATIFIGGIIADKRRKDGKREEWDRKIAEVLEEVDVMRKRNDERTALADRPLASAVKKGISTRTQVLGQRRTYSTSQNAQVVDEVEDASPDPVEDEVNEKAPSNENDLERESRDSYYISPLALQAVRTLSVQRLALKLILRPGVIQSYGQPDFFRIGPRVLVPEFQGVLGQSAAKNIQRLLHKLSDTQRDLHLARTGRMSEERLQEIANPGFPESQEDRSHLRSERASLDDELERLFHDFFYGRIELKDLLFNAATNLLQSPATPRPRTYEILAHGFSKALQQDLVRNVLDSLRESRMKLTSKIVRTVLLCYIRAKDLFSFDNFIKWLRGKVNYSDYLEPWKTVVIGGREVGVPPLRDERILCTLVYGALSFDQPHRAEMWLAVLRRYGKDESPHIWSSYLKYFALTSNWDEGQQILSKAYKYLQSTSFEPETGNSDLEWMVFWMLHLCLMCEKFTVYRRILNLAVGKGLKNIFTQRELYKPSQEARKIALDWHDASVACHGEIHDGLQHPDATRSDLFGDLEFPGQETDEAEFSPKVKPGFNLRDEKAAFDARAAVLKSHTMSTVPLRKPSDGAVLKYSTLGYTKEDLDSDLLWNGLSNESTTLDGGSTDTSPSSLQTPLGTKEGQPTATEHWEFEPPLAEPKYQHDISDDSQSTLSEGSPIAPSEGSPNTQLRTPDNRPPPYPAQGLEQEVPFTSFIDQTSPVSTQFPPKPSPPHALFTSQQNIKDLAEQAPFTPFIDQPSPLSTPPTPQSSQAPERKWEQQESEPLAPNIRRTIPRAPLGPRLTPKISLREIQLRRLSITDALCDVSDYISTLRLDVYATTQTAKTRPSTRKTDTDTRDNRNLDAKVFDPHRPVFIRKVETWNLTTRLSTQETGIHHNPNPEEDVPVPHPPNLIRKLDSWFSSAGVGEQTLKRHRDTEPSAYVSFRPSHAETASSSSTPLLVAPQFPTRRRVVLDLSTSPEQRDHPRRRTSPSPSPQKNDSTTIASPSPSASTPTEGKRKKRRLQSIVSGRKRAHKLERMAEKLSRHARRAIKERAAGQAEMGEREEKADLLSSCLEAGRPGISAWPPRLGDRGAAGVGGQDIRV